MDRGPSHRDQRATRQGGAERLGIQLLSSGIDVMDNQVDLGAVAFDPSMQVALDEEYGADLVHVEPALHPM